MFMFNNLRALFDSEDQLRINKTVNLYFFRHQDKWNRANRNRWNFIVWFRVLLALDVDCMYYLEE